MPSNAEKDPPRLPTSTISNSNSKNSNKRKSTTNPTSNPTTNPTSNPTTNPTDDTKSKKQKKDKKALSQKEKQILDIGNKLYNLEVEAEDSDDIDIPGDQKKKFESIEELEKFSDSSYLNKNAPYIPYIHQLSTEQKNAIINQENLAIGAIDLGIRDIFTMLTIPEKKNKFKKPSRTNSKTLNYSSKERYYNLATFKMAHKV
jgi:hypothetical protein